MCIWGERVGELGLRSQNFDKSTDEHAREAPWSRNYLRFFKAKHTGVSFEGQNLRHSLPQIPRRGDRIRKDRGNYI